MRSRLTPETRTFFAKKAKKPPVSSATQLGVMPENMKTKIKVYTEAKTEKNALVVLSKIKTKIEFNSYLDICEPYDKGGHICTFEIDVPSQEWTEIPYKLLTICQRIGYAWQLSGNIEEEFDAWSNETNISGVSSVHVQCSR